MGSWEGLNRRQFPRINYPCLIVIRNDSNGDEKSNTILTHTENIGVGGVCVTLKQDIKMFSVVEIELDLLDLGDHICCSGKIVWSVQRQTEETGKPKFYDVGIEYIDITEENRARLGSVIDRLVKNNI